MHLHSLNRLYTSKAVYTVERFIHTIVKYACTISQCMYQVLSLCVKGDEYNIVIVNTVRSLPLEDISDRKFVQPDSRWLIENLGFVIDPHQINVGITRAKHGLIIIGTFMRHAPPAIIYTCMYFTCREQCST